MSELLRKLRQFEDEDMDKVLSELKEAGDDREKVSNIINKYSTKMYPAQTDSLGKAFITQNMMSSMLGEQALREIEGLDSTPHVRAKKIVDEIYKGLPEVRENVELDPKKHKGMFDFQRVPKMENKLEFDPAMQGKWGYSDLSGVTLKEPEEASKAFKTGINLHEMGHQRDDALKGALFKLKALSKLKNPSEFSLDEKSRLEQALLRYIKENPSERKVTEDIVSFKSKPYDIAETQFMGPYDEITKAADKSPLKYAKKLTDKHFYDRHYEFDNLMKALKGDFKGIKAIGPLSAVAQVVPAIADVKEGNPNKAIARLASGLAPAGAGELEEELMQQAEIADDEQLSDPGYVKTLQNIGKRREAEGRSPIIESFGGQEIDTSDGLYFKELRKKLKEQSKG